MNIGVYSGIFNGNLDRLADYCHSLDVKHVWLAPDMADGFAEKGYLSPEPLARLKEQVEKRGLVVGVIHLWARDDYDAWKRDIPRSITAVGECSLDTVLYYNATRAPEDQREREQAWKLLLEAHEACVKAANEARVKLAIHPHHIPRYMVWNAETAERMMTAVPSPNNGVTMCPGVLSLAGDDVIELTRRWAGKIHYAHARNVVGRLDEFEEVRLDAGQVNFPQLLKTLKEVGFEGVICPEHLPAVAHAAGQPAPQALAIGYLKGILDCLGECR